MPVRYSVIAIGWLCLFSLSGAAGLAIGQIEQEPDGLEQLRLGIRMVEDGDYAAAIDMLEAAAVDLEADDAEPRAMARSYFYAGVARVFIVGDEEARFAFLEAQRHDPDFRPAETEFPRRVIRLWNEVASAGAMAPRAESAAGRGPTSTLTVTTEPAGATVYVAGRPRGETPVEIAGLRPGNHRITIIRDGYVNNSRMLTLPPNQNELLNVALTSVAGGSGAAELQDDSGGGGGGGWWKWAALAGGGGAAAYLALTRNSPPVAGLRVTPTGSGMAGVTQYRFDGGASSDPDNDQLTYSWNFGDGGSGSGRNATHVYASAGTYAVTLTVSDGKEQATAMGSATVARNLAGRFVAESVIRGSSPPIDVTETLRLTQDGSSLSGTFNLLLRQGSASLRGSTSVSGNVVSTADFVCPCDVRLSGSGYNFTGTVDNGSNVISGQAVIQTSAGTIRGASVYERQ